MNLLEFAVQRKLDHDDQLLDYVAKNQDVPVDVLSASLLEVIGPLEDRRATLLVENYTEMLSEYVPMTYKRDLQTGEYIVEGEIDEGILDSISLVHDIDAESAISQMIEENIRVLTNTPAEVQGLDLSELEHVATQLKAQTIHTISDDVVESVVDEAVDEAVEQAVADEAVDEAIESVVDEAAVEQAVSDDAVEEVVESVVSDDAVDEVVESVADEAVEQAVSDDAVDEAVTEVEVVAHTDDAAEEAMVQVDDVTPDAVDETVAEAEHTTHTDDVVDETVLQSTYEDVADEMTPDDSVPYETATEIPEEVEPELTPEEEQQIIAEKMKRIYYRLVEDIKELGLDKSLGLAL